MVTYRAGHPTRVRPTQHCCLPLSLAYSVQPEKSFSRREGPTVIHPRLPGEAVASGPFQGTQLGDWVFRLLVTHLPRRGLTLLHYATQGWLLASLNMDSNALHFRQSTP